MLWTALEGEDGGFEGVAQVLGGVCDPGDVLDVSFGLGGLHAHRAQRGGVEFDAPVGAVAVERAGLVDELGQAIGGFGGGDLALDVLDPADEFVDEALVGLGGQDLLQEGDGGSGTGRNLPGALAHRAHTVDDGGEDGWRPILRERAVREVLAVAGLPHPPPVGAGGGGQHGGERLAEGHCGRVAFADAALGRVDGGEATPSVLLEQALELDEVGEHLLIGVDGSAHLIGCLVQAVAGSHDALPLEHFQRAEARQLAGPDLVDGGAGGVVLPVGEAQVLADEDDRVAAHVAGEVIRQVGDGGAGRDRAVPAAKFAEQRFGQFLLGAEDATREGVEDRGVGLGLDDQRDAAAIGLGQTLVEPAGDLVVVECGDEVRADAAGEHGLEDGLDGDDDDALADAGIGELVEVSAK